MKPRVVKAIAIALIILASIGLDQASKSVARAQLPGKGTIFVVGSVFVIHYVENEGAFLGLGGKLPASVRMTLLMAFPILALAGVVIAMFRSKALSWSLLIGLSLVAGGGFGNLADRLFHAGHVSDFLNLGIGNFRTGIFNLADLCIMTGCALLLLAPTGKRPSRDTAPDAGRRIDSGQQ